MLSCAKAVHVNWHACTLVSPLAADHQSQNSFAEFEDEFEDVERQCTVLYNFEGAFFLRRTLYCLALVPPRALSLSLAGVASLQATTRAPSPSRRGSCWVWWRRIKETAGWGSSEAAGKRDIYLHPMSNPTHNPLTLSLREYEPRWKVNTVPMELLPVTLLRVGGVVQSDEWWMGDVKASWLACCHTTSCLLQLVNGWPWSSTHVQCACWNKPLNVCLDLLPKKRA